MEGSNPESLSFRAGYVGLVGEPNVGKSTLLNAFLGQKLSIVTPKPQTTRHKILGILSTEALQAIFLDTPGLIEPRYALHRAMMKQSASALEEADIVLFLVDTPRAERAGGPEIPPSVQKANKPTYLVLNKIDGVSSEVVARVRGEYQAGMALHRTFAISALRGTGVPDIVAGLALDLPLHPPYYPLDIASDRQERFFVAEIIREKIFLRTHDEVPYSASVEIVQFKERDEGKWFISADVILERESQKGIVIGKGGALLKEIGKSARIDIEKFLGKAVFLDLHVKVRDRWREREEWVKRFGYQDDH